MRSPSSPSRAVPALLLVVSLAVFGWVYSDYAEGHSVPAASFLLPPLAVLALGGLVDPRILWSVGPRRRELPTVIRVVGAIVFGIGLATTALLLLWNPGR